MITVLARFEMLPEREIETLTAVREMVAAVKEKEPGCLIYTASRGKVNGRELYFFEVYEDEKAFEDHARTEHMRALQATLDETIDNTSFNVESLEQIGGFTRCELRDLDDHRDG